MPRSKKSAYKINYAEIRKAYVFDHIDRMKYALDPDLRKTYIELRMLYTKKGRLRAGQWRTLGWIRNRLIEKCRQEYGEIISFPGHN